MKEQVLAAKEGKPCMDCGVVYPVYVMDFDHVRGEKLFEISRMTKRGFTPMRLAQEIAKCDLVCSNCHRIRTFTRGQHRQTVEPVEEQQGELFV